MSGIEFRGPDNYSVPINFVGMYSDGVPMVKTPDFVDIVKYADTMVVRPSNLSMFVTAMFLHDALVASGASITRLVIPYFPGARQDRINEGGDVLFTALSVADMVQLRFEEVVILDPHSRVTVQCLTEEITAGPCKVFEYPLERIAQKMWQGYGGIIAPDKGAKQRAETFGKAMNLPVVYADKIRDVTNGRITGYEVSVEAGMHYLVVDDICDGGATFNILGDQLIEQGAYADLYVSHGIFSKGTAELRKRYKNIITTDSRDVIDTHVLTVPVLKEMENYNG